MKKAITGYKAAVAANGEGANEETAAAVTKAGNELLAAALNFDESTLEDEAGDDTDGD